MKTRIVLLTFISITLAGACTSKNEKEWGYGEGNGVGLDAASPLAESEVRFAPPQAEERDPEKPSELKQVSQYNNPLKAAVKKIIKDGSLSLKTADIHAAKKRFDATIKELKGYYETENLDNNDQAISYNLKIRIPAGSFEMLISKIEQGPDEIKSKSIQARDVTEEYIDIESRLTNKREYLKRYKDLLSKAVSVKDILAIEENIRVLQEEIESSEGRLKYLNDQVSFSTLDVNIFQEKEFVYRPPAQDKFSERIKTSLSAGWTAVVNFLLWTVSAWPVIIIVTAIAVLVKRWRNKRKNRGAG